MLTVAVDFEKKKSEKPLWYKNMIRTSRDGMVTIMVVEDDYDGKLKALVLNDAEYIECIGTISENNYEHWIEECPIVVEDASLTLGGTVNW